MLTRFAEIVFDKETHTYTYEGKELTSVSKIIKKLKPPFDQQRVAQRTADRDGLTVEQVLANWEKKRQESMAKGTKVHEYIQKLLTGQAEEEEETDSFLRLNQLLPEMRAFAEFWSMMDKVRVYQCEWVVGDAGLYYGIAGTADCVLYSQETGRYHLWDWKTGSKFGTNNRFQTMLNPFSDLDDCELVNYSLQTSLYRIIIEANTTLDMGDSYILHLQSDGGFMVHKALDLRARINEWLNSEWMKHRAND